MIKTKLIKGKNYPELMEGKYIPDSAKEYIRKNMKGCLQAKTNLCSVDVEINYALFKQSEFNNLKLVNDRIKKALCILRFLLFYTPKVDEELTLILA